MRTSFTAVRKSAESNSVLFEHTSFTLHKPIESFTIEFAGTTLYCFHPRYTASESSGSMPVIAGPHPTGPLQEQLSFEHY